MPSPLRLGTAEKVTSADSGIAAPNVPDHRIDQRFPVASGSFCRAVTVADSHPVTPWGA